MSKYDATETTVVPGVLRGYRAWRVSHRGLESMTIDGYQWGLKNHARCFRYGEAIIIAPGHRAPVRGCTCGFYAKHTLEGVLDEFRAQSYVYGSIRAYGRVILGDKGFKAEYAEIEALLRPSFISRYALGDLLNSFPVYESPAGLLRDYPPISVENLLPEPEPKPTLQWGRINASAQISADFAKLWADYTRSIYIDKES